MSAPRRVAAGGLACAVALAGSLTGALAAARPAGAQPAPTIPVAKQGAPALPAVAALGAEELANARRRLAAGDAALRPAFDKLRRDADKALAAPVPVVTDKKALLPPSGDAHDYLSLSPYWWPDPSKPDGLPYIRRDGETNPESKRDLDQPRIAAMGAQVQTLALAWWLGGDERYADGAARRLRAWFLDPATRMTPHLRYAQLVRGNDKERGSGIIDARWFIEATDAAALLEGSRAWTAADAQGLRSWMKDYLRWLLESPNGQQEAKAKNNHGSWYAAQAAAIALYVGDTVTARRFVTETRARIGWQITPAGEQPTELERTRSLHYSNFNVEALARLAEMGRRLGVDLWAYEAPEGGSLRRATDRIAAFAAEPAKWPGQQLDAMDPADFLLTLRRGAARWGGDTYAAVLRTLTDDAARKDRSALLYP